MHAFCLSKKKKRGRRRWKRRRRGSRGGGEKKRKKKTVSSVRILCLEEEGSISVKGERCLLLSMEINLPVVQFNVLEKNILFS